MSVIQSLYCCTGVSNILCVNYAFLSFIISIVHVSFMFKRLGRLNKYSPSICKWMNIHEWVVYVERIDMDTRGNMTDCMEAVVTASNLQDTLAHSPNLTQVPLSSPSTQINRFTQTIFTLYTFSLCYLCESVQKMGNLWCVIKCECRVSVWTCNN